MMDGQWRKAARVYQERAAEYDSWYEGSLLFKAELAALHRIERPLAKPKIEIGIGPGRFAQQLAVDIGIDPAYAPLLRAAERGISGISGIGEQLPLQSNSAGTLFMLFTLCFVVDPALVFAECQRVLKPGGHLVVGQIPAHSSWGKALLKKKKEGNPFYEHARFYSVQEAVAMIEEAGFVVRERYSTLLNPPGTISEQEEIVDSAMEEAGFCVLLSEAR